MLVELEEGVWVRAVDVVQIRRRVGGANVSLVNGKSHDIPTTYEGQTPTDLACHLALQINNALERTARFAAGTQQF